MIVWGLWDCESLVSVYAKQEDAETDRAVLHAQVLADWDHSPAPDPSASLGLEVWPLTVATSPRHAADNANAVQPADGLHPEASALLSRAMASPTVHRKRARKDA